MPRKRKFLFRLKKRRRVKPQLEDQPIDDENRLGSMMEVTASISAAAPPTEKHRSEFTTWLDNKPSRQSTIISRAFGEKIIQYLRTKREKGIDTPGVKYDTTLRVLVKKKKFQLLSVIGLGDILCLPITDKQKSSHAMLGQHRQVIFKEDMFDVIDNAHKNGKSHRGYKGTFRKINATYCNIPRSVVHKYAELCDFCQKNHSCFIPNSRKKSLANKARAAGDPDLVAMALANIPKAKPKELEMAFLTKCQIDIIDMESSPDGQFIYVGHFVDHHTKYNVLFPLKQKDAMYVAKKLCRYVFSHFGLPRILYSNHGREFVNDVIMWVLQLWSTDAQILSGNPRIRKMLPLVHQRQKTVLVLIETIRAKTPDNNNWSSWLPGIQYSLNTNQFEFDSSPAYDTVLNRRPRIHTYANSSKEIINEEDVKEFLDGDDEVVDRLASVSSLDMPMSDTPASLPEQDMGDSLMGQNVLSGVDGISPDDTSMVSMNAEQQLRNHGLNSMQQIFVGNVGTLANGTVLPVVNLNGQQGFMTPNGSIAVIPCSVPNDNMNSNNQISIVPCNLSGNNDNVMNLVNINPDAVTTNGVH